MTRRYAVFGDSISTFKGVTHADNACFYDACDTNNTGVTNLEQTWWMQVINAEGGALLSNASFSGSMVAGEGFPAGCSKRRAMQILGADGSEPDVILVFIGINDYGWGSAHAQELGCSSASPAAVAGRVVSCQEPHSADEHDIDDFANAYQRMLANLRSAAPHAEIRCLTIPPGRLIGADQTVFCWQLRGLTFDHYNDAIRTTAREAGCTIVDIAALGFDYDAIDGTHPTPDGMQQLATMVLLASPQHASAHPQATATPDAMQSTPTLPRRLQTTRTCYKTTCIDCPFARNTGAKWSLICEERLGQ